VPRRFGFGLAVSLVALVACGTAGGTEGPRTVIITIEHSAFDPAVLSFEQGDEVRFVIRNTDPIDHEFILGDEDVQIRHENGTEPYHPPRPGEVTILAGTEAVTTWTFEDPGDLIFGCHIPGHYAYGMRGTVTVV
jgi:uncharacterized cupredoxin-like copper-binding protein